MAIMVVLQVLLFLATLPHVRCSACEEEPAIYIFGDSTADVATNSFLPSSKFRADFPHNGIDFPHSRATGRFSNGLNGADFLAKLLRHKRSPPPFLSLNSTTALKRHSLNGINFASGGSGLLDLTGATISATEMPHSFDALRRKTQNVVPLSEQIQQFSKIHDILTSIMGPAATKKFLAKSLFIISVGSNDIFNYFSSNSTMSMQEFMSNLGSSYENQLKNLMSLGARKLGTISVPPIGCCPSQRVHSPTGECLELLNTYARAFHSTIRAVLKNLRSEHKHMIYSLGNTYQMTIDVIRKPLPFNFKDVKTACCGGGKFNGQAICTQKQNFVLSAASTCSGIYSTLQKLPQNWRLLHSILGEQSMSLESTLLSWLALLDC